MHHREPVGNRIVRCQADGIDVEPRGNAMDGRPVEGRLVTASAEDVLEGVQKTKVAKLLIPAVGSIRVRSPDQGGGGIRH
jgi:hypothetical protein